jgi:hypothetical protein
MGTSIIANGLNTLVKNTAKLVGKMQIGINKILWGVNNKQPSMAVNVSDSTTRTFQQDGQLESESTSTKYAFTQKTPAPTPPGKGENLLTAGLFNALDILAELDLCNIIASLTDMINIKKKPRNPPNGPWRPPASTLYYIQDQCGEIRKFIDKYLAYPNEFIGSYLGVGPNAKPPAPPQTNLQAAAAQATGKDTPPSQGGTAVQKYNMYFLMQSIKDLTDTFTGPNSIFSAEEQTLLSSVPGLGGCLNFLDDFTGIVNKYSDYRNIPNEDLQKLINKINQVRSICVTIENLDFKSALSLVANYLGVNVREEIQKLSDFLNPTRIIPTLKEINNSIRGFIKIGQQVQGMLSLGQFIIKIALVFTKVFRFVIQFITNAPIPAMGVDTGTISRLESAKFKAKDETNGVDRVLRAVNALLSVLLLFIRYLVTNANELLVRLDRILTNLQVCEAVKDSDVLAELQETRQALVDLRDQLLTYLDEYDSKTNPNTAVFGIYDIRIIDEEITDREITNRRRRGVALAPDGQVVVQSDLTFATNPAVIIGEVQQKLLALGLISTGQGILDAATLDTVAQSINYLNSNDIAENDLNIDASAKDSASVVQAMNISDFLGSLPGGAQFKQKSQSTTAVYAANAQDQVKNQKDGGTRTNPTR